MIELNMIASPIAGAVIGYFTNWLAIKMMFKPYTQKSILGIKIPFTPGLIPKEKERIANTLGGTVGNCLLTEETIMESLTSHDVVESFENMFDDSIKYLKNCTLTVDEGIEHILKEEKVLAVKSVQNAFENFMLKVLENKNVSLKINDYIYSKLCVFLDTKINSLDLKKYNKYINEIILTESRILLENGSLRNSVEKGIWDFIIKLKDDERKLNEVIPYSSIQGIKDYISIKMPNIVNGLLEMTNDPVVEKKVKEKIGVIISQFAGSLVSMFVSDDKVYSKIKIGAKEYFNNPENQSEIDNMVGVAVDKIMETTIGGVAGLAAGEMREFTVNKIVDAVLNIVFDSNTLEGVINKFSGYLNSNELSLKDIIISCEPEFDDKIKVFINGVVMRIYNEFTLEKVSSIVKKRTDNVLNMNICDLMVHVDVNKINKFKSIVFIFTRSVVKKCAPYVIEALNIPQIVENRINSFDMKYTEDLVFSIAQKELHAITVVGGALGFIIGCVPVIIGLL